MTVKYAYDVVTCTEVLATTTQTMTEQVKESVRNRQADSAVYCCACLKTVQSLACEFAWIVQSCRPLIFLSALAGGGVTLDTPSTPIQASVELQRRVV